MVTSRAKTTTKSRKTTKTTTKKPPVAKKTLAVKSVENTKAHFTHDILEAKPHFQTKKTGADTSMFTTLLALFIVAFVVLGGFVYSRQAHKTDVLSENLAFPSLPSSYQPSLPANAKPVSIASTVMITPELETELQTLSDVIYIDADDMLVDFSIISDVVAAQAQNSDFYKHANVGDYAFQFKNRSILYRPSELKIINVVAGVTSLQR